MRDIRLTRLAELLVNYSAEVKKGENVLIYGDVIAEPLLNQIYLKVLEAGANPLLFPIFRETTRLHLLNASDEQLENYPAPLIEVAKTYDAVIFVNGESNTQMLNGIDPARMVKYMKSRRQFSNPLYERAAKGEARWTLTNYPTEAYAQDAGMSLEDYQDFVFSACMPDANDPIGYWEKISARQDKIVDWMKGKKRVHVTAPETDLHLSIEGRQFVNCDCHKNVPDGEVFTGPVEDSVEGHVYYSYPAIHNGREVKGIRLWFENGKVVKATAEQNEDYLLKLLDSDEGSRRVGEFAIGTNEGIQRFTRQILFDEKIGGSFHMAVGMGFAETGSVNQSAIHWDMICDLRNGGAIWVDDELLYQNGRFVIDF